MKELAIKIRHRCNTKEIWESVNPLLDLGEIGVQIPTAEDMDNPNARWFFKFGDGKHRWKDLPWASADGDLVTDITLEIQGMAADAKATGEAIKALQAKLYTPVKLKISDSSGTREKQATPPTSITFNLDYSGEVDLKTGVIVDFTGKSHTITESEMLAKKKTISGLSFTMHTNKKSTYDFTFEAKELKSEGNGNTTPKRSEKCTVTFADKIRYGFFTRTDEDDKTFLDQLPNKIFEKTKDGSYTPKGEQYFYICYPAYMGALTAKVNAFATDFSESDAIYFYGENLKVPYKICRSPEQYKEKVPIYFTID